MWGWHHEVSIVSNPSGNPPSASMFEHLFVPVPSMLGFPFGTGLLRAPRVSPEAVLVPKLLFRDHHQGGRAEQAAMSVLEG